MGAPIQNVASPQQILVAPALLPNIQFRGPSGQIYISNSSGQALFNGADVQAAIGSGWAPLSGSVFMIAPYTAYGAILSCPSGTQYVSDSAGEALVGELDIPYAISQGWVPAQAQAQYGVSVESLGASPLSAPSVNTSAIQSALNLGSRVTVTTPGIYQLSAVPFGILTISDNTTLFLGAGVVLQGPPSTSPSNPIIVSRNWRSNHNNVTAITSTYTLPYVTTTVQETLHGRKVGQYVLIKGDTTGYYNGIWRISAVVDQNNYQFTWTGIDSAPPNGAGTIISYAANYGIKVIGDGYIDFQYNTNNGTQGYTNDVHGAIFNKIANWTWAIQAKNVVKYGLYYGNSWDGTIGPTEIRDCGSSFAQGIGPLYRTRIVRLNGAQSHDDVAPVTCNNTNFTIYDMKDADGTKNSDGNIEDIDFDYTSCGHGGSRKVLLQSGQGWMVRRATIRGYHGSDSTAGLYILLDVQGSETGGFEDILVDGYAGNQAANTAMLLTGTTTGSTLNIKNLVVRNVSSHGGDISGATTGLTSNVINGSNAACNITGLTLDNIDIDCDLTNASASLAVVFFGAGAGGDTWNQMVLSNIRMRGNGSTRGCTLVQAGGAAQWDSISILNSVVAGNSGSLVVCNSSTADPALGVSKVIATGCVVGGGLSDSTTGQALMAVSGGKNLDITMTGCIGKSAVNGGFYVFGGSSKTFNVKLIGVVESNAVIYNAGTSHTFNVWANGVSSPNFSQSSGNLIHYGTTSTWNFNGNCADIGVDLSSVARKDGTIIYNTNSALGTLGATGLVVGQGTAAGSWHLMSSPTLTY